MVEDFAWEGAFPLTLESAEDEATIRVVKPSGGGHGGGGHGGGGHGGGRVILTRALFIVLEPQMLA